MEGDNKDSSNSGAQPAPQQGGARHVVISGGVRLDDLNKDKQVVSVSGQGQENVVSTLRAVDGDGGDRAPGVVVPWGLGFLRSSPNHHGHQIKEDRVLGNLVAFRKR